MTQGGEVHTNLVGAAGVKLNFRQRGGIDAGERAPVGAGFAGVAKYKAAPGGHACAALGVAGDGEVDSAVILLQKALHESDVGFLDLALAEGFAELGVSGVVFGDEKDAGSVFVGAIDDAGAEGVGTLGEGLAAAAEGVDQGAAGDTGASVHGHAGGLVDGDDVGVFVENVEGNGFGFGAERGARLDSDLDALAATKAM